MGAHVFGGPELHFVLPTVEAEAAFNREVPNWRETVAIEGD